MSYVVVWVKWFYDVSWFMSEGLDDQPQVFQACHIRAVEHLTPKTPNDVAVCQFFIYFHLVLCALGHISKEYSSRSGRKGFQQRAAKWLDGYGHWQRTEKVPFFLWAMFGWWKARVDLQQLKGCFFGGLKMLGFFEFWNLDTSVYRLAMTGNYLMLLRLLYFLGWHCQLFLGSPRNGQNTWPMQLVQWGGANILSLSIVKTIHEEKTNRYPNKCILKTIHLLFLQDLSRTHFPPHGLQFHQGGHGVAAIWGAKVHWSSLSSTLAKQKYGPFAVGIQPGYPGHWPHGHRW